MYTVGSRLSMARLVCLVKLDVGCKFGGGIPQHVSSHCAVFDQQHLRSRIERRFGCESRG